MSVLSLIIGLSSFALRIRLYVAKITGMDKKYNHKAIETKWQKRWEQAGVLRPEEMRKAKKPFYNLWMFPYPSAEGLHAGHAFASTGSDVQGRYQRMRGRHVFQPIGFDSFGIHSENFAIKIGDTPQNMLKRTTATYTRQLKSLGHGYDWTRTVTTSDVDYYRWTQWLFIELFKAGLAYKKKAVVNWCPSCKTVLADEQIMTPAQAGKIPAGYKSLEEVPAGVRVCERCGSIPEQRELSQWFLRITDYADRLLTNLNKIDWSERVVKAQREWIGKKEGIKISYPIEGHDATVVCFTTRPDTNFGATFVVVSPEYAKDHLLKLVPEELEQNVSKYIETSLSKTEQQRQTEEKIKTGVFTGLYAINRLNGYKMPIWVSDFVLAGFGTGAVVGVPGHDKRDFEFARTFNLPVVRVVVGPDGDTSEITNLQKVREEGEGVMINSGFLNGLGVDEAIVDIVDYIEKKGWGKRETAYHLRDWLISRQRYWGPPIPMIYCEKCAKEGRSWFSEQTAQSENSSSLEGPRHSGGASQSRRISRTEPLHADQSDWESAGWWPEENLPVELPEISDFKPKGEGQGPLADHPEFYETTCPACGAPARRETDVSDTFLDSSWYFLAYPNVDTKAYQQSLRGYGKQSTVKSAKNNSRSISPLDPKVSSKWLPVNLYFGGAEHAVLHLMYARFVTQALHDLGYLDFEEPFPRFFAHGLMINDGAKMSKSRGNIVNPDTYIEKFGADTLRLYLMFMGPMDGSPDFRDSGIEGARRFIARVWNLYVDYDSSSSKSLEAPINIGAARISAVDESKLTVKLHQTIKKVSKDMESFSYNTALAAIMELVNAMRDNPKDINREVLVDLCKLLAPFTPHLCEEIWCEILGEEFSVHLSTWPQFDPKKVIEDTVAVALQVNGKTRSIMKVAIDQSQDKEALAKLARENEKIKYYIEGKNAKEIVVPGKIVNFVF